MQAAKVRIGTRGSPLALAQAHDVQARLAAAHGIDIAAIEIVVIKTSGDQFLDRPLADIGGKGLFTKEIEEALIARTIDLAVHSMKDVPTVLPEGLHIASILPREDVRDAFISLAYPNLAALPAGSIVGTSSLRRQAQVRRLRPDVEVVQFRGNVQTRLKKLADGVAHATFLAVAGLNRLGLRDRVTSIIETEDMLPAVAQGAVGIEIRSDDAETARLVSALNDDATSIAVSAERAFLATLEGSCRTPIAGLAIVAGNTLSFRGQLLSTDGRTAFDAKGASTVSDAEATGVATAEDILTRAGKGFLAGLAAPS